MVDDLAVTEIDKVKYEKLQKAKEFEKNVNDAISIAADLRDDVKKIKEEICEGPDCLKQQVSDKFGSIDEKIKKIEEKTTEFLCENCGYQGVRALSSFCPNCGHPIYEWNDDDGTPIPGWKHWDDRNK